MIGKIVIASTHSNTAHILRPSAVHPKPPGDYCFG